MDNLILVVGDWILVKRDEDAIEELARITGIGPDFLHKYFCQFFDTSPCGSGCLEGDGGGSLRVDSIVRRHPNPPVILWCESCKEDVYFPVCMT